jgi:hypothetical protein
MARQKSFDWQEAVRLREAGLSYPQIAAQLGVDHKSVYLAVNPQKRAEREARRVARKALELAIEAQSPARLTCSTCKRDKPDEEFSPSHEKAGRRRRSYECRACSAERRRRSREAQRAAIILKNAPRCPVIGCFHSAVGTITFGTFRNWIPLPTRAISQLGQGVPLCHQHYAIATAGNTPTTADRSAPKSAPTLERILSRAERVA